MNWALVFIGIVVVGTIAMIAIGVWLVHRVTDLWSEVKMLGKHAGELAQVISQIEFDRLDATGQDNERLGSATGPRRELG